VTTLATFDSQTGILMVGHGSREPEAVQPLLDLSRGMEARLEITPVQPCYLEIAQPAIDEGLAALHRRGVQRVIVLPLQLTAGRHVQSDIPREVGRSLTKLSNMLVCFTEHLGAHPRLMDIADSRLTEALAGRPTALEQTEFVLVARGSHDPLVRGEIVRLAGMRGEREGAGHFTACFLAMAEPTFEEGLQRAASRNPNRIVVQPHLLYPGRLLAQIHGRVAEMTQQYPQIEWVSTEALGPDPRLVECTLDLALNANSGRFQRAI